MKKYVSFIGSLLFNSNSNNEAEAERIRELEKIYCHIAKTVGKNLVQNGHSVKVGSFSELDLSVVNGAVDAAKEAGHDPMNYVCQLVGEGVTRPEYINNEAALIEVPGEDDFISGNSYFISQAKAIILLGGHHYAKMLASWALRLGLPVFALPQCGLAGKDIWQYLIKTNYNDGLQYDVFPGVSYNEYEELGIQNLKPDLLADRLFTLIDKSSANWVEPSILPLRMRYRPKTNQVDPNTAFIAMPFDEKYEPVFAAMTKACKDVDFSPIRGDNKEFYSKDLNIMSNVTESIVRAHVIIVDISDRNPNVFYEMGIADSLGKSLIITFDGVGDPAFDVQNLRHLRYDISNLGDFSKELAEIIKSFKVE